MTITHEGQPVNVAAWDFNKDLALIEKDGGKTREWVPTHLLEERAR